ncbi:hypothetical protein STAS_12411 [Striga asiatica]|uniref:Uncharacterized protein n=1 Tax=Striga asiatica TaxID=4170 RepID=A0A5A7PTC8_STRAF|nr:hypothetical protein STAS_12411 [Striga asiatica]
MSDHNLLKHIPEMMFLHMEGATSSGSFCLSGSGAVKLLCVCSETRSKHGHATHGRAEVEPLRAFNLPLTHVGQTMLASEHSSSRIRSANDGSGSSWAPVLLLGAVTPPAIFECRDRAHHRALGQGLEAHLVTFRFCHWMIYDIIVGVSGGGMIGFGFYRLGLQICLDVFSQTVQGSTNSIDSVNKEQEPYRKSDNHDDKLAT